MDIKELEDRIVIRELVDAVSFLSDKKDIHSQVQHFTENAVAETIIAGSLFLRMEGRDEMIDKLGGFQKNFLTIYHFNGQQVINVSGNTAVGTMYCFITLIGMEKDKKVRTTIGATFEDEFIRENDRWLISKRIGNFEWQDKSDFANSK